MVVARSPRRAGEFLRDHIDTQVQRAAKTPQLHIADTGMGAALLELDADDLNTDRVYLGHLLESFVLAELRAQASWHDSRTSFHHFRGLRKLREIAGDSFKAGVVLYDGTVGYRHDENLWALPISMLWEANT